MTCIAYSTTMHRSAIFSACRTWRYRLDRIWDRSKPIVNWIALNPSVADETTNDKTITREILFTQRWGFGGLIKTNMFGYISTDARALNTAADPVGPETDQYLVSTAHLTLESTGIIIIAWGAHTRARLRAPTVLHLLEGIPLMCLGYTKHGAPSHPLYLKKNTSYEVYR